MCAENVGGLTDVPQRVLRHTATRGVVEAREDDRKCVGRDSGRDFIGIDLESARRWTVDALYACTEMLRGEEQRFVRRPLQQDLVARLDQCRQGLKTCH